MYVEVPPSELMPKYDRFPVLYDVQLLYMNSHSPLPAANIMTGFTLMFSAFHSGFNSLPESHALSTLLFGIPLPATLLTGIPQIDPILTARELRNCRHMQGYWMSTDHLCHREKTRLFFQTYRRDGKEKEGSNLREREGVLGWEALPMTIDNRG